ncbi:unnamed protein product [Linum trigynum]|uniref:Uncharacterized protein n=1 Tax=Linum trigynum TaxID=586398 RepID=A0AAV2D6C7_9ROSI
MFRGRLITRTPPACSSPPLVPAGLLRSSSKPPIPVSAGHSKLSMTMHRFSMQQMKDHIKSIASTMEQKFKTKKKIKDEMELRWLNRLRKRKHVNYV